MMPTQLAVFFMAIYVLESLTIITQNSFIVAVLGREWVRVKRMSSVDMILISLGFCRFCLQWSSVLYNFYSYFNPTCVFWHMEVIWEFTNTITFWLTSLLAVVTCVKVSSFTHPAFLWLRWRILRLVPWLLLGSLLISCLTIIFAVIRNHVKVQLLPTMHRPQNNTVADRLETLMKHFLLLQELVLLSVPFLLFVASTILLISSLSQHLAQMQHHTSSQGDASTRAHATALRSLAVFLIFFTSYFLSIIVSFTNNLLEKRTWFWAWETIVYAMVSIHCTSLVLSNSKLKKVLKVRCCGPEAA